MRHGRGAEEQRSTHDGGDQAAVTRGPGERIMYRGHRETIMTSVIHASLGHSLRRNIRIDYDPGDPSPALSWPCVLSWPCHLNKYGTAQILIIPCFTLI